MPSLSHLIHTYPSNCKQSYFDDPGLPCLQAKLKTCGPNYLLADPLVHKIEHSSILNSTFHPVSRPHWILLSVTQATPLGISLSSSSLTLVPSLGLLDSAFTECPSFITSSPSTLASAPVATSNSDHFYIQNIRIFSHFHHLLSRHSMFSKALHGCASSTPPATCAHVCVCGGVCMYIRTWICIHISVFSQPLDKKLQTW